MSRIHLPSCRPSPVEYRSTAQDGGVRLHILQIVRWHVQRIVVEQHKYRILPATLLPSCQFPHR